MLGGCQPDTRSSSASQLAVQLSGYQQPASCQQFITVAEQHWQLQHLRFYLSDFSLNQQPLALTTNQWQQPRLALLGTDCQGNSNWQLHFAKPIPEGQLSFTLGLPFTVNHQNPLTANAPLNHSELFWSWQLGYKFLRLDLQGPEHGWAFHLGSTGCQSSSVLRPPTQPCRAANTVKVTLDYQRGQRLQLELAMLLDKVALLADNSCMSDGQQASCQMLFGNLAQPNLWRMVSPDEHTPNAH
ncbi:AZL_007920/MXAN_0976 family protein [Arsukibacterium tuosuense]|uniref:AZL_007920/MXAN_0976 family protein n=2 Tax=Arsukibacterium tuosuense TaxID=1323745 RepID=A0A285J5R7_9GAMM|nr:AZL_007920/MXAN_0976 family protein [Arsukibacterium tuosuense]